MSAPNAGSDSMNRFSWDWRLSEVKQDKPVKVFSCFACGGGSCMGYKRAGFEVLGCVEIDPAINAMYRANLNPKYNFLMDLREFNKLEEIPDELIGVDILDGSPPCTTFSSAGKREETWGKEKVFREGQAKQTLDDLFFVFLDTVEKLKPKVVIAENVVGLVKGKAKGYVHEIVNRFRELGYAVQIFSLNAAHMDVPQARHRVFFVASRDKRQPLQLNFRHDVIPFGAIRTESGVPMGEGTVLRNLAEAAKEGETNLSEVAKRIAGEKNKYFTTYINWDKDVAVTITSSARHVRGYDRQFMSDEDIRRAQTFPEDYDFCGNDVMYVCGMSVPPNMMANIATEVYDQWLRK